MNSLSTPVLFRAPWSALGTAVLIVCGTPTFGSPQTSSTDSLPEFEVASIKPTSGNELNGIYTYAGGRIQCRGCTLQFLIRQSLDVQDFQLSGGPGWIDEERYDVEAKPPESSATTALAPRSRKTPPNSEQRKMLLSLLQKRFSFAYRTEAKSGVVYLLSRGTTPLLLKAAANKDTPSWSGSPKGGMITGDGLAGKNETMPDLASRLSRYLASPVLDRTGLAGSFDFSVEYPTGQEPVDVPSMIRQALRDIGLALIKSTGPIQAVVVERAEKPLPN